MFPILSTDTDLSYFDLKIEGKRRYVESVKKAAELEIDSTHTQWFESVIENMNEMLDLLTYCKIKLQMKMEQANSRLSGSSLSPSASNDSAVSLSPVAKTSSLSPFGSPSHGPSSYGAPVSYSPRHTTTVDETTQALRLSENLRSVILMNISEVKSSSDLDDVQKILSAIGVSACVEAVSRFSPKALPADRPPFLKVRFSSDVEKKEVLASINSNISVIRSSNSMFAQIAVCDPAKSGKADNNHQNNAVSKFGSSVFAERHRGPLSQVPSFARSAPPSSAFGQHASSPFSQDASKTVAFSHCASPDKVFPSTFGSRQFTSPSTDRTRFGSNRTPQSSITPATIQPSAKIDASNDRSPLKSCLKRTLSPTAKSRLQKTFFSPETISKSFPASRVRYTSGRADGVYTSDESDL
uniref:Uncharacterized protein n=1 Tax=Panagrolaimus sp. PS1159 TaxID=55785 RepID=A0AC35F5G6_9BILA